MKVAREAVRTVIICLKFTKQHNWTKREVKEVRGMCSMGNHELHTTSFHLGLWRNLLVSPTELITSSFELSGQPAMLESFRQMIDPVSKK